MRHVISSIVRNRSGVLASIANLFASRGYNIDSLAVGETVVTSRISAPIPGMKLRQSATFGAEVDSLGGAQ